MRGSQATTRGIRYFLKVISDFFRKQDFVSEGCDPRRRLQKSLGSPGPKSQGNLNMSLFGGSAEKSPKIPQQVRSAHFVGARKEYSQEFVFPRIWRSLGESFGANSY